MIDIILYEAECTWWFKLDVTRLCGNRKECPGLACMLKEAAMLEWEKPRWLSSRHIWYRLAPKSTATFLLLRPTYTKKCRWIAARVHGNVNQYGGCGGHLGWAAELVIERNLSLTKANKHKNFGSFAARVHEILDGNENQYGGHLGWAAELVIERNLPLTETNNHT